MSDGLIRLRLAAAAEALRTERGVLNRRRAQRQLESAAEDAYLLGIDFDDVEVPDDVRPQLAELKEALDQHLAASASRRTAQLQAAVLLGLAHRRGESASASPPPDSESDDQGEDLADLLTALRRSVEAAGGSPRSDAESSFTRAGQFDVGDRAKLTVSLPSSDLVLLAQMAEGMSSTRTTALARAIRLAAYLHDAARQSSKVFVEDPNGKRREIVIL